MLMLVIALSLPIAMTFTFGFKIHRKIQKTALEQSATGGEKVDENGKLGIFEMIVKMMMTIL